MKEYLRKYSSDHPSLYDAFQLGDRVTRIYQNEDGKKTKFKGIVLKIAKNSIEVYWDTKDGKYIPKIWIFHLPIVMLKKYLEGMGIIPLLKELFIEISI